MPTPEQPIQVQPDESQRIGDAREAVEAAYGEKPARDFMAEHKEMTPEQRDTLNWFATAEGEKALVEFQQLKAEQQNAVRQKVWKLFDVSTDEHFKYGIVDFASKQEKLGTQGMSVTEILARVNEVTQHVLQNGVDAILQRKASLQDKISPLEQQAKTVKQFAASSLGNPDSFSNSQYEFSLSDNYQNENVEFRMLTKSRVNNIEFGRVPKNNEAAVRSSLDGMMIGAVVAKNWKMLGEIIKKSQAGVTLGDYFRGAGFDDFVGRYGTYLAEGHEDAQIDEVMTRHNYIFNPGSEQYEKVE